MKKIYLLAAVAFATVFSANAQFFTDDIESYPLGTIHTSPWVSWDGNAGTADDISVSSDQALSGTKSILVAEGGVIDGVLDLGNQTSGTYYLDFNMYIPAGKSGYFNIQNTVPVGDQWNYHCSFNIDGAAEGEFEFADASGANQGPGTVLAVGSYTPGEWFLISFVIDLDNGTLTMSKDGSVLVDNTSYTGDTLGAINFYSLETGAESNRYYIDDARFQPTPVAGVDDFSSDNFSVYPNPVRNVLNIQTTNTVERVVVYDVLGKVVLSTQPDAISPRIDMSELSSGAYMVNVTIDGASKTVKVIK
ncbi:T9SS type A sorting domain-containing protein [Jejudonia soesokkakensis]|uniref:T9SS type A sorting domain-containing protein n=1 Tax=Jejudonia soesokkakensis TaxID=1323432 RepID=A0ABW2MXW2_9FLAO